MPDTNDISMRVTIPSTRIYKDEMDPSDYASLLGAFYVYSDCKEFLYNTLYDNKYTDHKTDDYLYKMRQHCLSKNGIKPKGYHQASLYSHANGMLSSQNELQKQYNKDFEAQCKKRADKVKALKRRLTLCKKTKQSLIECSKNHSKEYLYLPHDFEKYLPNGKNSSDEELYLFECWIDSQLRSLPGKINSILDKDLRMKALHSDIPKRATFGGAPFYKLKDTTDIDMQEWHRIRSFKRSNVMLFGGRYDSKDKNWLCSYNDEKHEFTCTLITNKTITLHNVDFPYRKQDLMDILNHPKEKGYSVGYWLERHIDSNNREYLLVKASFDTYNPYRNFDTCNGVISVDMNYDNISWTETDGNGCIVMYGMERFNIDGLTSNQANDVLGRVCTKILSLCVSSNKPLVMEDLDLQKKKSQLSYGNRKANRKISMFAYHKITNFFERKAFRLSIGVIKVSPEYTSFIGKVKYMAWMRAPVHVAASYVIGRRGMGLKEKIPKYLTDLLPKKKKRRHYWSQFSFLMKKLKNVPINKFSNKTSLDTLIRTA